MISKESLAFMEERRKTPAFGADGFDLEALRAPDCMGARVEPTDLPVRWTHADADDIRSLGAGAASGSLQASAREDLGVSANQRRDDHRWTAG